MIPHPIANIRLFFGIALALLAVLLGSSLWTTARLRDSAREAARAYGTVEAAAGAHSGVNLLDSAVRGYLADGDASRLGGRPAAAEETRARLATMDRLLDDVPEGGRRRDGGEGPLRGLTELHERLIARRSEGRPTPAELLGWLDAMDTVHRRAHRLINEAALRETVSLGGSVGRARDAASAGLVVNGVGGLTGIAVVLLAAASTLRDARARLTAQRALVVSEERFRAAFAHAPVGMVLTTVEGGFLQVNPAFCALTGYSERALLAMDSPSLTHPDDREASALAIRGLLAGSARSVGIEKRYVAESGGLIWARTSVSLIPGGPGGAASLIAQVEDVSERRLAAERLAHQASHDGLTGLPNRALFLATTRAALEEAGRLGGTAALLLIDLDGFKRVNDTYGHHYGNVVLEAVARRLAAILRVGDMAARLGGDEFAVLLPGADRRSAVEVADRVVSELGRGIEADGHRLEVGASVGIAMHPEHAPEHDALLRRADLAMYAAKRSRSGRAVYAEGQPAEVGQTARGARGGRRSRECRRR